MLDMPHGDVLTILLKVRGRELSRVMINIGNSIGVIFYDTYKGRVSPKPILRQKFTPLIIFNEVNELAAQQGEIIEQ